MIYRIRSFSGPTPILGLDVTTNSQRVAAEEVRDRADRYGGFEDVQLIVSGERPFRGDELADWLGRALGGAGA